MNHQYDLTLGSTKWLCGINERRWFLSPEDGPIPDKVYIEVLELDNPGRWASCHSYWISGNRLAHLPPMFMNWHEGHKAMAAMVLWWHGDKQSTLHWILRTGQPSGMWPLQMLMHEKGCWSSTIRWKAT
ncbi:MAG: hypothetical protein C7B43_03575 [Sulfobacillus benefaciens]|uniref:Uncharacterized protein n=1 Tax=Sulfobacillus benefaciens TaxID=453960 RepID=A0A2T2X9J6_9FIRM|nr:MAG: hypothetical protein C7B43_03575 [Sulfobacillus benefaciens]